jgi:hypothetical protein
MLTMSVTPEEMNNIGPRLPVDVTASHMMLYDPENQTLHYGSEIAHLVEAIDKTIAFKRVPEKISSLQIRLELINHGALERVMATIELMAEPDRSILKVIWDHSHEFRRDDPRVIKILEPVGLNDIDDFFVSAAERR